jgi:hypothetical protein
MSSEAIIPFLNQPDLLLCVFERKKRNDVQALIAKATAEGFKDSMNGLSVVSGPREGQRDFVVIGPRAQQLRDELAPIVPCRPGFVLVPRRATVDPFRFRSLVVDISGDGVFVRDEVE